MFQLDNKSSREQTNLEPLEVTITPALVGDDVALVGCDVGADVGDVGTWVGDDVGSDVGASVGANLI